MKERTNRRDREKGKKKRLTIRKGQTSKGGQTKEGKGVCQRKGIGRADKKWPRQGEGKEVAVNYIRTDKEEGRKEGQRVAKEKNRQRRGKERVSEEGLEEWTKNREAERRERREIN